jgi:hypothetical protein
MHKPDCLAQSKSMSAHGAEAFVKA